MLLLPVCDIVVSGDQNMPRTARKTSGSNVYHVMLAGVETLGHQFFLDVGDEVKQRFHFLHTGHVDGILLMMLGYGASFRHTLMVKSVK